MVVMGCYMIIHRAHHVKWNVHKLMQKQSIFYKLDWHYWELLIKFFSFLVKPENEELFASIWEYEVKHPNRIEKWKPSRIHQANIYESECMCCSQSNCYLWSSIQLIQLLLTLLFRIRYYLLIFICLQKLVIKSSIIKLFKLEEDILHEVTALTTESKHSHGEYNLRSIVGKPLLIKPERFVLHLSFEYIHNSVNEKCLGEVNHKQNIVLAGLRDSFL